MSIWITFGNFVVILYFVLPPSFFFLAAQIQAVSDGGKREQPVFPRIEACLCVNVFQKKISDLVSLSVKCLGDDKWVCLCLDGLQS